jgi:hypothetical protein
MGLHRHLADHQEKRAAINSSNAPSLRACIGERALSCPKAQIQAAFQGSPAVGLDIRFFAAGIEVDEIPAVLALPDSPCTSLVAVLATLVPIPGRRMSGLANDLACL